MRTEAVADQHSRLTVRLCSCQRIEHLLDPFEVDAGLHIPIFATREALAWYLIGCPATNLRDARLDDQWGKGLAVYADTLYGTV